ncbi:MAG: type I DNA topoisomerase [Patescibacteria group bacterium]|nr:type I DNA topoisomerase [Patescibacteria group bacterium]
MPNKTNKLLIVESPAKAKTIEKYLNNEYTVRASVGHVRDLPKSNKNAIDIEGGFIPHYEISKGKEKIVSELKEKAKKAEEIVLATDPDREGEAIAWHVAEVLKLPKSKTKRITFNEITEGAVQEAMKHPRDIDEDLLKAQEARRVLDRLFGYDLSGLIWQKLRYGLSAGRVQSPALRILVEREREIRAFIPEKFWVIDGLFATSKKEELPAHCTEEPKAGEEAEQIVTEAKKAKWQIKEVKQTEAKRSPRPPFTTSTLQQAASSRLGYSPSITMRLAQKLYEAGHITYMRTDSTNLSQQALGEIARVVKDKFGTDHLQTRRYAAKSKSAQEAHEAVRPSHANVSSAGKTPQEQKLYKLIWSRVVASQMSDAKIKRTKLIIAAAVKTSDVKTAALPNFETNGSITTFDGWLKADPAAKGEETELPVVEEGETLDLKEINSEGKETLPPNRYTEAGLVKELEKRGIGRPSTYAPTIKTIIDRGYVDKESRSLKPTETGDVVSEFLENNFASYISDSFTSEMENELDEIADGKRDYVKTLKDFYGPFTLEIASKKKMPKITNLGEAPDDMKCPTCDGPMIIKLSRSGKFYSCAKFPECTGAKTLEGKEMAPKETGEACPECKNGKLVEREGRFGTFVSCANYPKCKYIKKDEAAEEAKRTGVKCPVCKKGLSGISQTGEMTEKRGRFGIFYSCSNYPTCKNAIKAKPTGALCTMCGSLMMQGTKTIPERCSSKSCPNHNPHKLTK